MSRDFRGRLDYSKRLDCSPTTDINRQIIVDDFWGSITVDGLILDGEPIAETLFDFVEDNDDLNGFCSASQKDAQIFQFIQSKLNLLAAITCIDVPKIIQIHICVHAPLCVFVRTEDSVWPKILENSSGKGPALVREGIGALNLLSEEELLEQIDFIPRDTGMLDLKRDICVGLVELEKELEPEESRHAEFLSKVIDHEVISEGQTHCRIASKLIYVGTSVEEFPTIIDLVCALANKENTSGVDLLNISLGFSSCGHSACLLRILASLQIPVVCSAGNDTSNNDYRHHWPSNFATFDETPNVIAVAAVNEDCNLWSKSNWGPRSVTVASIASFSARASEGRQAVPGATSLAAAWTSRSIAAAMSISEDVGIDLEQSIDIIKNTPSVHSIYQVMETGANGALPISNQIIFRVGDEILA